MDTGRDLGRRRLTPEPEPTTPKGGILTTPYQEQNEPNRTDGHIYREIHITHSSGVHLGNIYNNYTLKPDENLERRKIIEFLFEKDSVIDVKRNYEKYLDRWQKNSGQWIFDSETFKNWYNGDNKRLWYHGIPGVGKTIVATNIVRKLNEMKGNETRNVGLAYLYCDRREVESQTTLGLIKTVLHQLSQQSPEFSAGLKGLYERYSLSETRPMLDEYVKSLTDEVRRFHSVYLVIDAIDECNAMKENGSSSNPSTRFQLHRVLKDLGDNVHLLFTSRDVSARSLGLDEYALESIKSVELKANSDDIELYLRHQIKDESFLRTLDGETADTIVEIIVRKAAGMFLLAHLQMKLVEKSAQEEQTPDAVKATLEDLPEELDDAYQRMFTNILDESQPSSKLAHGILACLVFCSRPLDVDVSMIRCVVALGKAPTIRKDRLIREDSLIDICQGLVTIDNWRRTAGFIHYTALEYVLKPKAQQQFFSKDHLLFAERLILYLSMNDDPKDQMSEDQGGKIVKSKTAIDESLYNYARSHWGRHAKFMEKELMVPIKNFIDNKIRFERCFRAIGYSGISGSSTDDSDAIVPSSVEIPGGSCSQVDLLYTSKTPTLGGYVTGLHASAYFDLQSTVQELLKDGVDIEAKDSKGYDALRWAVKGAARRTIAFLLEHKADVWSTDCEGISTVNWALHTPRVVKSAGHVTIFKDGESSGSSHTIDVGPLSRISSSNTGPSYFEESEKSDRLIVVDQLLDYISRHHEYRSTNKLLSVAAANWNWPLLQRLLEIGADIDSEQTPDEGVFMTPLLWALQFPRSTDYTTLFKIDDRRVAYGKQEHTLVNMQWQTPHAPGMISSEWLERWNEASLGNHIQKLIGNKFDAKNEQGRTALSLAVENRFFEVAKKLMERGADPNSRDHLGMTPLHWSSCLPRFRTMHFDHLVLRDNGLVDICLFGTEAPPPQEIVIRLQVNGLARLLLENGADKTLKNVYEETALDLAIADGLGSVARLLQNMPVPATSASTEDTQEASRLQWALYGSTQPSISFGDVELGGATRLVINKFAKIRTLVMKGNSFFSSTCNFWIENVYCTGQSRFQIGNFHVESSEQSIDESSLSSEQQKFFIENIKIFDKSTMIIKSYCKSNEVRTSHESALEFLKDGQISTLWTNQKSHVFLNGSTRIDHIIAGDDSEILILPVCGVMTSAKVEAQGHSGVRIHVDDYRLQGFSALGLGSPDTDYVVQSIEAYQESHVHIALGTIVANVRAFQGSVVMFNSHYTLGIPALADITNRFSMTIDTYDGSRLEVFGNITLAKVHAHGKSLLYFCDGHHNITEVQLSEGARMFATCNIHIDVLQLQGSSAAAIGENPSISEMVMTEHSMAAFTGGCIETILSASEFSMIVSVGQISAKRIQLKDQARAFVLAKNHIREITTLNNSQVFIEDLSSQDGTTLFAKGDSHVFINTGERIVGGVLALENSTVYLGRDTTWECANIQNHASVVMLSTSEITRNLLLQLFNMPDFDKVVGDEFRDVEKAVGFIRSMVPATARNISSSCGLDTSALERRAQAFSASHYRISMYLASPLRVSLYGVSRPRDLE